jgi:hypothetical protein
VLLDLDGALLGYRDIQAGGERKRRRITKVHMLLILFCFYRAEPATIGSKVGSVFSSKVHGLSISMISPSPCGDLAFLASVLSFWPGG